MSTYTEGPAMPDHDHSCRSCGGTADECWTPNEECVDHPGDCSACRKDC